MSAFRSGVGQACRSKRAEEETHAATSLPERRNFLRQLPVRLQHTRQARDVDPLADIVDENLTAAAALGAPIAAVFETHVQADHLSGVPVKRRRT
jgi:glyoxylase-like metal-dependent hydrolase (beta-lactamase superfamily II)